MKKTSLRDHMRRISKRGVEARRAKRAAAIIPRADWPLPEGREPETVSDWLRVGAVAAKAMWNGGLPSQVAKEIAGLVRASLAAFKMGDLAEKLERYEEIVSTIEARGSAKQQRRIAELEAEVARLRASNGGSVRAHPPADDILDRLKTIR